MTHQFANFVCNLVCSGIDDARWNTKPANNNGWGHVKLTAAKPRRK